MLKASVMLIFLLFTGLAAAQDDPVSVECGAVVEAELTLTSLVHRYAIELAPGDTIIANFDALGEGLEANTIIQDPADNNIKSTSYRTRGEVNALIGGRGTHFIQVQANGTRTGIYRLTIQCVLRDGTVIEPGTTVAPNPTQSIAPPPTFGFPGLAPVDFANALKLPLIAATPMTGAITPNGGEILGFQFDASAGDVLDLSLTRISGNLNLGLVVLSANNEVVSYGGLISGDTFSTRLTLPNAGQYTIGVFRVDLLPPGDPQATAFQVTGTLNP